MSILAAQAAQILNKEFNGTNYSAVATWYVGLLSGGTELSGSGYARVAVTANTTNFPATSTNSITNGIAITFPAASADWATADQVGLFIASSGGTAKYTGDLDPTVTVRSSQIRQFDIGELTIRMI